jgi:hypothetical protein
MGGWLPVAVWLPAVVAGAVLLWAWWKGNEFCRLMMACAIWGALLWLEVFLIGAPRLPGISVVYVNQWPKIVAVDGRHFSAMSCAAFAATFGIGGWLAWYASKFPRYWHKRRVPKRPWYLDFYENTERRL